MARSVFLTDGAARDVDEGYAGAYDTGGRPRADLYLDRIRSLLTEIEERPGAGVALATTATGGGRAARQLRDGEIRIVYVVRDGCAYVVAIAPSRQSMQALLHRRTMDG